MKPNISKPSQEDVLNAFAVEPNPGPETLDRYLRNYPECTADLVELSRDLLQPMVGAAGPLSEKDKAMIDAAWKRHQEAALAARADPFAVLTVFGLREIARVLGVRRQIVAAFRERKVIVASVPQPFLARLASALSTTVGRLTEFLTAPPTPSPALSYKADGKPSVAGPATFEQLLVDSGVPEAERAKLMAGD